MNSVITFLLEHMRQYGEVVGSRLKRGRIKGTDIETWTRYVPLVNCKEAIPHPDLDWVVQASDIFRQ